MGTPEQPKQIFGRTVEWRPPQEYEGVAPQISAYLDLRDRVTPRPDRREGQFLRGTFYRMVKERNERAHDVKSPEGNRAIDIAERLMPLAPYFVDCIDGRVMRTIKYGIPLGVGGAIERPAGDMTEFVPAREGGLVLQPDSNFAKAYSSLIKGSDGNGFVQVLDSHVGCAAREGDEATKGKRPEDHGLYADVVRKKQMVDAMLDYKVAYHDGHLSADTYSFQTSYDPETGFMYMGLEGEDVLEAVKETGFTVDVLDELAESGEIIHTKKLLDNPEIRRIFEDNPIDSFDWEANYRGTIAHFWEKMKSMVEGGLLDPIYGEFAALYGDRDPKEIDARAMLLALNAYNAYNSNKGKETYPYATHKESCIVVSEGEHGPYDNTSAFAVSREARNEYGPNISLAESIVRSNRDVGRVTDLMGLYTDNDQFREAPVPMLQQVVIRNSEFNGDKWNQLHDLVWSPAFQHPDWYKMTSEDFGDHVLTIDEEIPAHVLKALDALRQDMAELYDPKQKTSNQLFGGQLEVVPVIVDAKREIKVVVPFIHQGFPKPLLDPVRG